MKTLLLLFAFVLGICPFADAQQAAKIPRVGYLSPSMDPVGPLKAFLEGLRDLGYVEGNNIAIEKRSNQGKLDRTRDLAGELVRLKVDVIVAIGSLEIGAAKDVTATIPIVMVRGGDPVASGYVATLARPGGNITGLALLRPELGGKRLELLKEIVPKLLRVAVFSSPNSADYGSVSKQIEIAAAPLGVKILSVDVANHSDVEIAFQQATKLRTDGILFRVPGTIVSSRRAEVAALALKTRIPVMYETEQDVEAGGLMSYGVNINNLYRRAATYVDKLLKGAKPGDLPVEQPTKFELVINLKTAKQIGLTIPPNVLARADRVIK